MAFLLPQRGGPHRPSDSIPVGDRVARGQSISALSAQALSGVCGLMSPPRVRTGTWRPPVTLIPAVMLCPLPPSLRLSPGPCGELCLPWSPQ